MFEKKAEEYANGKGHEHYNYLFEENAGSPATFDNWCFQDGAEFGYNKAKEELKAEKEYSATLRKEIDEYTNSHTLCAKYKELEKENAELLCQMNRNKSCYSCANATERCFRNEIGCPCQRSVNNERYKKIVVYEVKKMRKYANISADKFC